MYSFLQCKYDLNKGNQSLFEVLTMSVRLWNKVADQIEKYFTDANKCMGSEME